MYVVQCYAGLPGMAKVEARETEKRWIVETIIFEKGMIDVEVGRHLPKEEVYGTELEALVWLREKMQPQVQKITDDLEDMVTNLEAISSRIHHLTFQTGMDAALFLDVNRK